MNPVVFNCLFLYLLVILLSLLQSRFRLIRDDPFTYILVLLITPLLVAGKAKGIKTWTELTGIEIFVYTLVIALINGKRILPRLNEGYIFAYTLFHWYLLCDTVRISGFNFWVIMVMAVSLYPTILILKNSLEHRLLRHGEKKVLYYWFLFTIIFTYIDQVALDIVKPVVALDSISFNNLTQVLYSAVQLYFISTILSLLFVATPLLHMDRSAASLKERWAKARAECREILDHKLDHYIEYQISGVQVAYITILSGILFFLDSVEQIRSFLIFVYTVLFPLVFFYFKWTPPANLEDKA